MHETGTHFFAAMERVIFGTPAAQALANEATRLGTKRIFLAVSRTLNTQTAPDHEDARRSRRPGRGGVRGIPQHTSREVVAHATQAALEAKADLVVAVGGGSVVDAAKIMMLCIEHRITDPGLEGLDVRDQAGDGRTTRDPGIQRADGAHDRGA